MAWHRTVAIAAPRIPMLRTKMKIGSMIVLEITVNSVRVIASFGFPEERSKALSPK